MTTEQTMDFEPASRLAEDPARVRKEFWKKLKRVAAKLPFVDLSHLLLELLVNARAQVVAHDDVDDGGCDRNGRRHCDRRCDRKTQPERHGSRRTYPVPRTVWISRASSSASVFRRR